MSSPTMEVIERDPLALRVAGVLTLANEAAVAHGMSLAASRIAITEEVIHLGPCWRVHYGPRDYLRTRGGDLLVFIDQEATAVIEVLIGQ